MNAAIEQAIVAYLTAQLSDATLAVVVPGPSEEDLPNSKPVILCLAERRWDVGPQYYAVTKLKITTPAKVAGYGLTSHQALGVAVENALFWQPTDDVDQAALNAAKDAALRDCFLAAGYVYEGHCPDVNEMVKDLQASDGWQTIVPLTIALAKL